MLIFSIFFNFCRFWCPSWRVGPTSTLTPLPCNPSHIGYRLSLSRNFFRAAALFPLPELARGRKERHMTNGCEHLLLFGFIFSKWNQKCYQNAPNLYQNEAIMLPKTDKMVPRSFQKPIRTPRSSFDGRKAPKIDQNLSQWCQNGSKMLPKWSPKASKIDPKSIPKLMQKSTPKKSRKIWKNTPKTMPKLSKKTSPNQTVRQTLILSKTLLFLKEKPSF